MMTTTEWFLGAEKYTREREKCEKKLIPVFKNHEPIGNVPPEI